MRGETVRRYPIDALHNRSKHAEDAIARGEFPENTTLAVWLDNDGLRSTDAQLTFDEVAHELRELGVWADLLQDPLTLHEKLATMSAKPDEQHSGSAAAG